MLLLKRIKNNFLKLVFPKKCFGCGQPDTYLCLDCLSTINISHSALSNLHNLSQLYFAADYQNFLVKNLIQKYKYPPLAQKLALPLASLIIAHLESLEKSPYFLRRKKSCCLVPIPLSPKRLRWRGFNQAHEIASILSLYYGIPLVKGLEKTKTTRPQVKLSQQQRKDNVRGSFSCPLHIRSKIKNKNVVLVDDVSTTGATLSEGALVLKRAGALRVYGLVVAKD